MPQPRITEISDTITQGNDWSGTFTLTLNGGAAWNTTGATITCSIVDERDPANRLISQIAVTNNGGTTGQAVLTLTDNGTSDGTSLLHAPVGMAESVPHIADFRVVGSDLSVTNADKFRLFVTRPVTV